MHRDIEKHVNWRSNLFTHLLTVANFINVIAVYF